MPDRASSEGRAIRQVELLSNKLLTTAFEASLESVAVTLQAKRRQKTLGVRPPKEKINISKEFINKTKER